MPYTRTPHVVRTAFVFVITIFTFAGCRSSLLAPAPVDFAELDRIRTLAGVRVENGASLFGEPFGVAVGADDTIYITDGERGCVWAIDERGATRKVVCDLATPSGIAVAPDGSLVLAETGAHVIRRIDPQNGASQIIAGAAGDHGFADGDAEQARFDAPVGIATDAAGVIYVADTYNDRIRRIDRAGNVTTIAGGDGNGYADSDAGAAARFHTPCNLILRGADTLIVADTGNHRLRRINLASPNYAVTTLAGTGEQAIRDGALDAAAFDEPIGLAFAGDGALLVTDAGGDALRRIIFDDVSKHRDDATNSQSNVAAPTVTTINRASLTLADDARTHTRTAGFLDGDLGDSLARRPSGIGVTRRGRIVFTDSHNRVVRVVTEADAGLGEEANSVRVFALLPDAASLRRGGAPRWAFDPADRPREIAATFGEVRGVIEEGKQAWWHNGLDIPGALGETVRFMRPEIVLLPLAVEGTGTARERLRLPTLGYIHVRIGRTHDDRPLLADDRFRFTRDERGRTGDVRVRRGTRFAAGEPVGTLNNQYHVHLIAGAPGAEVNALAALELPGIRDRVAPTIVRDAVRFERPDGSVYTNSANANLSIDGDARIVVRAFDQMDGGAARRRLGVYALGYRVLTLDGAPLDNPETDFVNISFERLPESSEPSIVYAAPSRAGYTPETFFDYIVTNRVRDRDGSEGMWHASRLAPGEYVVRVIARDFFGNEATEDFRVRIERRG